MPILSNWKLTFDPAGTPRVLLDFGQKMVQELRWPVRRGLEVVDIAEAAAPFLRVTGNAVVALSFEVFADEATDALSRRALLEGLIAVAALGKRPLRVEIAGISGTYWQFANAAISEHEPARHLTAPTARASLKYNIQATGLTRVGP